MTDPTETTRQLLRRAESYLSALHGSVARHDNLAANLGCAGCELRDQIQAALAAASPAGLVAVPPTTADRAALRDRIAEALEQADYRPDMRRGDLADAIMPVLPAGSEDTTTTRAAAFAEAADFVRGLLLTRTLITTTGLEAELRRRAAETQPDTEAEPEAHPPTHTWTVESPRRDTWASWGATYEEREWAQERCESAIENAPQRPFRLVRATTTYVVEAAHQPAAVQTDEEA